jgi:hypothetical protein
VQQGRSIVLVGHARAKYGSNSNGLREIGAESKIPALDPGVCAAANRP